MRSASDCSRCACGRYRPDLGGWLRQDIARKVPAITLYFWGVKILSTAAGESISDFAVHRFDPVVVVVFGFVGFVAALTLQLVVPRYTPWIYWLAATAVALFG